ncbi:hypothetical protein, partial [Frigoribacterium sp. JB110]|uniref:hypothetical protein n=1 Tax=Microbacterium sp. TaxID=51671 RepID=UPI001BB0BF94
TLPALRLPPQPSGATSSAYSISVHVAKATRRISNGFAFGFRILSNPYSESLSEPKGFRFSLFNRS